MRQTMDNLNDKMEMDKSHLINRSDNETIRKQKQALKKTKIQLKEKNKIAGSWICKEIYQLVFGKCWKVDNLYTMENIKYIFVKRSWLKARIVWDDKRNNITDKSLITDKRRFGKMDSNI